MIRSTLSWLVIGCLFLLLALFLTDILTYRYQLIDSDVHASQKFELAVAGGLFNQRYVIRFIENDKVAEENDLGHVLWNHHPEWGPKEIHWFEENALPIIHGGAVGGRVADVESGQIVGELRYLSDEEKDAFISYRKSKGKKLPPNPQK